MFLFFLVINFKVSYTTHKNNTWGLISFRKKLKKKEKLSKIYNTGFDPNNNMEKIKI